MAHDPHAAHEHDHAGKRTERRFTAEPGSRANFQALIGGLGVAALGAGTYATWMPDSPMAVAPYLFGGGTLAFIAAMVMGSADAHPIRVGDAGVAVERGGQQPERIAWYEVESIGVDERDRVVVKGASKTIVAPIAYHAGAAAWIVREGLERVPKRVTVPAERVGEITRGVDEHGSVIAVDPIQVAGRRCKASSAIISFERDARICERCGEAYDKKHAPAQCLTCEAPMTAA
jgi:hypothetical protein